MLQAATATQRNYIAQVAFVMNDADTLQLLLQHYANEFSAEAVQYMRELVSEIVAQQAIAEAQTATMH